MVSLKIIFHSHQRPTEAAHSQYHSPVPFFLQYRIPKRNPSLSLYLSPACPVKFKYAAHYYSLDLIILIHELKQTKVSTITDQKKSKKNAILIALSSTGTFFFEESSSNWASSHLFCCISATTFFFGQKEK